MEANIAIAQELKCAGNELVNIGDYAGAVKKYVKIFLYVRGVKSPDAMKFLPSSMLSYSYSPRDSQVYIREIDALELSANLNLALCYLKLQDYPKVIQFSTGALKVDEDNIKALFRRGTAFMMQKQLDEARSDLERAAAISPGDKSIDNAFATLKVLERKYLQSVREKFAGMFDK